MVDSLSAGSEKASKAGVAVAAPPQILTKRRRVVQIGEVVTRQGLGYLLARFGLTNLLPWHKELLVSDAEPDAQTAPVRLRKAFEQLGTTAIKLGQILSTRADLLPPEYLHELAKLRDSVPPVPTPAIRAVIEQEFNKPVEEIFAEFSDVPLAAASVGQVHVARLFSGEQVAVKIQKPGVAEQVEIDLQLLEELAVRAQRTSKIAREFDLTAIIEEFAWTLRGELDYQREGRNADAFREQFVDNPDVVIPTIYWDFSSRRVLTMQLLSGFKIDDLAKLEELNIDRHDLALRSANLVLSEIFVHGFYHADPHPGNFLILDGAVIGALDFGMVGSISEEMKLSLFDLVAAAIARDAGRIVDSMEALGIAGVNDRRSTLARDVNRMLERYVGLSLAEIDMGEMIDTLFATIRRNQLRMPAELVMLLKTLVMVEGVGRYLDPEFNTLTEMTPFVQSEMRRRMHPKTWKPYAKSALGDLLRVGGDFPGQLRRFGRRLDQGNLTVSVRMRELDSSLHRLEGMVNRLALSILVGALIIGAALLIVAYQPGTDSGWLTALFAGGMVVAVLLAIALIVSMMRSRRS